MQLKVLYITHYHFLYGANKSLLQLLIELKDRGVKPYVIVPRKGSLTDELEANKIEYFVFKFYNWLNQDKLLINRLKRFLNNFMFFKAHRTLLNKRIKIDVIHTNTSVTNLGAYLSIKIKAPHVWHIREYGEEDFNIKYYYDIKKVGHYFDTNSEKVITVSNDLKEYYSKYIPSHKMKVIYNGIPIRKELNKSYNYKDPLRIAIVGVVSKNKNQIELIKALSYLKLTKKNSNFKLYIIGNGFSKYVNSVKKQVKDLSLTDNVEFVGYVSDVEGYLKHIDLGVICSKREAFGRVTIEFMANKIPVIASDTGATKEIIVNKELGILYKYGNIEDLAQKIDRIENNRESLKEIGEKAFVYSRNNFSSSLNTQKIYDEYKSAVKNNGTSYHELRD